MWKEIFCNHLNQQKFLLTEHDFYTSSDSDLFQNYVCDDIDYLARMKVPMSTTAGEYRYYNSAIDKAIEFLPNKAIVLDLGCGDGRWTLKLLNDSDCNVISIDVGYANMQRIASRIPSHQKHRWLGCVGDATKLILPTDSLDSVFAIGLFHVLYKDIESILSSVHSSLKTHGLLVNSEATIEGAMLYAIVRQNFEEFQKIALTHTKTIDFDNYNSPRVTVISPHEMYAVLKNSGFTTIKQFPISVLPSLVYGAWFQQSNLPEEEQKEINSILNKYSEIETIATRVMFFLSRKVI